MRPTRNYYSTRFQQFLQQEQLVGSIVQALLEESQDEGVQLIYPPTLSRIVTDLEEVRNAREWLSETRRHVRDRIIGTAIGLPGSVGNNGSGNLRLKNKPRIELRPKFYLGHRTGGKWIVWTKFPSFKELCVLSADIRNFVTSTRFQVNGSDNYKPGRWLLFGKREEILKRWPNPNLPMIQFVQSNANVENILNLACFVVDKPIYLYRIGVDGVARELTSHVVRPGGRYIFLTKENPIRLQFGMRSIDIDCEGVSAYCLDVPADVSANFTSWLAEYKFDVTRTVRVWPAGLPNRGWDGQGNGEWSVSETPCIGMVHDYEVNEYTIHLKGREEVKLDGGSPGEPIFVRLPQLPVGKHFLTVKASRSGNLNAVISSPEAEGHIEILIREPEPWNPGIALHCGLIPYLDPHDANLENFWRNEVDLSVFGPDSRMVTVNIRLMNRKGDQIFSKQVGSSMKLPLEPNHWREKFGQFLKSNKLEWHYLEAASGELEISAEELGRVSFAFEQDMSPLRWVLKRNGNQILARLVDDTGLEEIELDVCFYNMKEPLSKLVNSHDYRIVGRAVEEPGGLLCARRGKYEDFLVVSSGFTGHGLKALGIEPEFLDSQNRGALLADDLHLYAKWHNARLYGPLVKLRWEKIINKFLALIFEKLCGKNWVQAEENVKNSPTSGHAHDMLSHLVDKKSSIFSEALRGEITQLTGDITRDRKQYTELAETCHVCHDPNLSKFAFDLANQAHIVPKHYNDDLEIFLRSIKDNPTVLRGARFLRLLMTDSPTL